MSVKWTQHNRDRERGYRRDEQPPRLDSGVPHRGNVLTADGNPPMRCGNRLAQRMSHRRSGPSKPLPRLGRHSGLGPLLRFLKHVGKSLDRSDVAGFWLREIGWTLWHVRPMTIGSGAPDPLEHCTRGTDPTNWLGRPARNDGAHGNGSKADARRFPCRIVDWRSVAMATSTSRGPAETTAVKQDQEIST